ncbi:MAG: hypothetical protein Q9M50_01200 [Methylococcales bacterium]|nr:hypothetical protein [Methylococcales bacterium]
MNADDLTVVSKLRPSENELSDLLFAWEMSRVYSARRGNS